MGARDWYVPLGEDAPVRLFAFPHAGAGSARMSSLAKAVAPHLGVWAANLPGRQARVDEQPAEDLAALVDELTDRIAGLARPPYLLLGYCGGALLAFLVARALRDRGAPPPAALVVVSFEAPDIGYRPRGLATLPGDRLWSQLISDGGVSPELAEEDRLRGLVEPAVRADFSMLADYRYEAAAPLPSPVVVCFGVTDPTPRGAWLGWRRQSERPVRLCGLPGGHWLLEESGAELAEAVLEVAAPVIRPVAVA